MGITVLTYTELHYLLKEQNIEIAIFLPESLLILTIDRGVIATLRSPVYQEEEAVKC